MDKDQREQVKEMLHEVLGAYHAKVDAQNTVTNAELKHINNHLSVLNGSVARNTKVINENLPHSVAHCPQATTIEKLKESMISSKAIKMAILTSIGLTGTLFGIAFVLYKLFTKTP